MTYNNNIIGNADINVQPSKRKNYKGNALIESIKSDSPVWYRRTVINKAIESIEKLKALGHDAPFDMLIATFMEVVNMPVGEYLREQEEIQKKSKEGRFDELNMSLMKYTIMQLMMQNKHSVAYKAVFIQSMIILAQNYYDKARQLDVEQEKLELVKKEKDLTEKEWYELKTKETTENIRKLGEQLLDVTPKEN